MPVLPDLATPLSLPRALTWLQQRLADTDATLLLYGPSGSGQAELATRWAEWLAQAGIPCSYLSADVGAPAIGVPTALNLGRWIDGRWQLQALEPLCSLNAARFRLPLVTAARRLRQRADPGPLLVDAPGVLRGVAAAELLPVLCEAVRADLVVLFGDEALALADEFRALNLPLLHLEAEPLSRPQRRRQRRHQRSRAWRQYLDDAAELILALDALRLLGNPPPRDHPERWQGAVVALGSDNGWEVMGEITSLEGATLQLRAPAWQRHPTCLLIRDACTTPQGELVTRPPRAKTTAASGTLVYPATTRPLETGPQITTRAVVAELVNGVFDDPLLLLQLRQSGRCLLFDLGECGRIPLRLLHRVSDIFISHAHIDHIGGFLQLLRARLGVPTPCRLYGPPGLARHIAGLLDGILWDRIGDSGPRFEVTEVHGDRLECQLLQAGCRPRQLPLRAAADGVLLDEPDFRVRCLPLDHGTPVLAFAFEPRARVQITPEALQQRGWPPGPWLEALKQAERQGDTARIITLPDGQRLRAAELGPLLLQHHPGERLVYATDLTDSTDNCRRLATFAHDCHTLFCEASFAAADAARASRNGHLTTRACAAIADAAKPEQLVPFHFSRRYQADPERHYREIEAGFAPVIRA